MIFPKGLQKLYTKNIHSLTGNQGNAKALFLLSEEGVGKVLVPSTACGAGEISTPTSCWNVTGHHASKLRFAYSFTNNPLCVCVHRTAQRHLHKQ